MYRLTMLIKLVIYQRDTVACIEKIQTSRIAFTDTWRFQRSLATLECSAIAMRNPGASLTAQ
jgi:hypothetical protein